MKLMRYQVRRRVVISRMSGGEEAPLILGILGWHGQDIRAGAVVSRGGGGLGPTGGRKQEPKAHFSLSRFGDYPRLPHVDISHGPC